MPHPNVANLRMSDGEVCCQTQQQQRGLIRHMRNVLPHVCLLSTSQPWKLYCCSYWCDCNILDLLLVDKNIPENVSQVIAKCASALHRWRHCLTGQADRHLSSTMWPASLSLLDIAAGRTASYRQQVILNIKVVFYMPFLLHDALAATRQQCMGQKCGLC